MTEKISYTVEKKCMKNMYLRVLPDGSVKVTAPLQTDDRTIREFVFSKQEWIQKKLAGLQEQPLHKSAAYESGEEHLLWGKRYPLEIVYTKGRACASVQEGHILMELPHESEAWQKQKLLEELYRRQLKARIPLLLEKNAAIVGKAPEHWGVKNMKTRWGTCNIRDKRIWLNLQLAKYEPECLEYVIVHELVHFYEPGHNAVFYGYMDKFYPHWREVREKLKG